MCIPLDAPQDAAHSGRDHRDPVTRLRIAADTYGLDAENRHELLEVLDTRMANGGTFGRRRVEAGEPAFVAMWLEMGGQARYDRRQEWFSDNRTRFEHGLPGGRTTRDRP